MKPVVAFFEIPALDMERAVRFYETIFDQKLELCEYGNEKMAFISSGDGNAAGCIFNLEGHTPAPYGVTVSFHTDDISVSLDKVVNAGGKVVTDPCETWENSKEYYAYFLDTEGNRIGLFTRK